jgi:hypothetical protein
MYCLALLLAYVHITQADSSHTDLCDLSYKVHPPYACDCRYVQVLELNANEVPIRHSAAPYVKASIDVAAHNYMLL